jgi:anti-sigma-K factor RskA
MTCEDFDGLLCDYIDGTLAPAKRQMAEVHIGSCAACAELVRDSRFVMDFAGRSEEVQPPKELYTRILNQVPQSGLAAQVTSSQNWVNRKLKGVFAPIFQPRFVMGAMMTLLSLSMLTRCAGPPKHPLTAADLDPVRLWVSLDDKVERTWVRSVKAYESMRLVYEVQSRVSEWKEKQQEDEEENLRLPKAKAQPVSESKGENTKK